MADKNIKFEFEKSEGSFLPEFVPELVSMKAMCRSWWIAFRWVNVTEASSEEIRYLKSGQRPIEEAEEAARQ